MPSAEHFHLEVGLFSCYEAQGCVFGLSVSSSSRGREPGLALSVEVADLQPTLHLGACLELLRPGHRVRVFVNGQELRGRDAGGVVVTGEKLVEPREHNHVCDGVLVASEKFVFRQVLVQHGAQALHLHA